MNFPALKFTVDLSQADCGCVAAVYIAAIGRNTKPGTGKDYYCDANKVNGVACDEIDLMEANKHYFRTTAHRANDPGGKGMGLGPNIDGLDYRDYGPGGACIDTQF